MRKDTLVFLLDRQGEKILLAMKKRGFGMGKFNGVGGKVEPGEEIPAAAVREAHEEIGVVLAETDLEPVGVINFSFEGKPEWSIECHVFFTQHWEGEPKETEEMAPQWFGFSSIPYERMWVDDVHWLPLALEGKKLAATFHFSNDGSEILQKEIALQ